MLLDFAFETEYEALSLDEKKLFHLNGKIPRRNFKPDILAIWTAPELFVPVPDCNSLLRKHLQLSCST